MKLRVGSTSNKFYVGQTGVIFK